MGCGPLALGKIASLASASSPTAILLQPTHTGTALPGPSFALLQVRSVADALDLLTAGETVHDYKPNDAAPATTATKTVRLQRLPRMLVLYLMRFDPASLNKVAKHVSFEPRLAMRRAWLTPDSQDKRAEYQLVATVSHHGRSISSGHYTADVLQPDGKFLRFDDDTVSSVSLQTVLSERVYLLFYARQN